MIIGSQCGAEVKQAVEYLLTNVNIQYDLCKREGLEKLQHLRQIYETIVEEELKLRNFLKKQK